MNFLINILSGVIVAVLIWAWIKGVAFLNNRKFRNVFGSTAENPFFIIYGLLKLNECYNQNGQPIEFPYSNISPNARGESRISSLVSGSQARGIKYLSESFRENTKIIPQLVSDSEVESKMDISYCSIGGMNNSKTVDILNHEENEFFKFSDVGDKIVGVKNSLSFTIDKGFDYALIIKLRPKSLQNKTWVAIAGIGEWGTSGASWFLARNWKEIEKTYNQRSFGLIIKVKGGKDESAQIVDRSP